MRRGDLSEAECCLLELLLPPERGRKSRPAFGNWQIVNGILWRICTGTPWRNLPDKFGEWITVCQRFRRWSHLGIWEIVATTLAQSMVD
ncbi:MAG: transposase, partial [Rhizomicrobium sp.]